MQTFSGCAKKFRETNATEQDRQFAVALLALHTLLQTSTATNLAEEQQAGLIHVLLGKNFIVLVDDGHSQ